MSQSQQDIDPMAIDLCTIALKSTEVWERTLNDRSIGTNAPTASAIRERQTMKEVEDLTKRNCKDKYAVNVTYIDDCDIDTESCNTSCDFTGKEVSVGVKEIEVKGCVQRSFSIKDCSFEKNTAGAYAFQDAAAEIMANRINDMDEQINGVGLMGLISNLSVNRFPKPWAYQASDKTTLVPDADWNIKSMRYFVEQAQKNGMKRFYAIDNGILSGHYLDIGWDAADCCGRGDKARMGAMPIYQDIMGFIKPFPIVNPQLFIIDPSAIALINRFDYPNISATPSKSQPNVWKYSVPSLNIPGFRYDVRYKIDCADRLNDNHTFEIQGRYEYVPGLSSCDSDTGILGYSAPIV